MATMNPYVGFNGKCREAMSFYKECLGGELVFNTVEGSPIADQCPPAMADQILHASLDTTRMVLMGTDMVGPGGFVQGNSIAISVSCDSEAQINEWFSSLSVGGSVIDALKTQFWGALFGVFLDKFGVCWMLSYDKKS